MSAAAKPNEIIEFRGSPEKGPALTTPLRRFEERTRALSLEAQMVECVDLLQSPEFVADDLLRSLAEIRGAGSHANEQSPEQIDLVSADRDDKSGFFYPSRELFVQGDGCSFTCLATEVDFREGAATKIPSGDVSGASACLIDYAAVTCESRPFPILGFTQHLETESAYPIVLRALASLVELTRPGCFDVLDRDIYRGLLGSAPVFDLALVLWDDDLETDPRRPLCELTRDLAEVLKAALRSDPLFSSSLNDIVCLRMNNKRFDGRLRFVWRV